MKHGVILLLAWLITCLITNDLLSQEIICKLNGKIIGRDDKTITLVSAWEDMRINSIEIPIVNNSFEYQLKVPFIEKYVLIFNEDREDGGYKPIPFFSENGTINFTLYPRTEYAKHILTGGVLTNKQDEYVKLFDSINAPIWKELDSLYSSDTYHSEKAKIIQGKVGKAKDENEIKTLNLELNKLNESGEEYTLEGKAINNKMDSIKKLEFDWQINYIKTNQDIFAYSLIFSILKKKDWYDKLIDLSFITNIFQLFSQKYPTHIYTKIIGEMLSAINTIKVGGKYIDFSAPNIEGKMIKLSEEISGKVALIDLWASWCGGCRKYSKSYIPVYEKYKNKGFVVVGVACESKDTKDFMIALKKDKYPWQNLIELDNKNDIWNKYGIAGSGGCSYLVDSNGNIVIVHPTAEEVEKYLNENMK